MNFKSMIQLKDIPEHYTYCFAGKGVCPKADTCLRAIAAQLQTESPDPQPATIHTVNALYVKQLPDLSACSEYRDNKPVRYAKGMTRLFEELPLKHARIIRKKVMRSCFSCETYFYRSRKGTRLISPEEQRSILQAFRSAGLDITPKFDEYRDEIDW